MAAQEEKWNVNPGHQAGSGKKAGNRSRNALMKEEKQKAEYGSQTENKETSPQEVFAAHSADIFQNHLVSKGVAVFKLIRYFQRPLWDKQSASRE